MEAPEPSPQQPAPPSPLLLPGRGSSPSLARQPYQPLFSQYQDFSFKVMQRSGQHPLKTRAPTPLVNESCSCCPHPLEAPPGPPPFYFQCDKFKTTMCRKDGIWTYRIPPRCKPRRTLPGPARPDPALQRKLAQIEGRAPALSRTQSRDGFGASVGFARFGTTRAWSPAPTEQKEDRPQLSPHRDREMTYTHRNQVVSGTRFCGRERPLAHMGMR